MISLEEFKSYLDKVVEMAFKEGVVWKTNAADLVPFEDAIKNAQRRILENKQNNDFI